MGTPTVWMSMSRNRYTALTARTLPRNAPVSANIPAAASNVRRTNPRVAPTLAARGSAGVARWPLR